MSSFLNNKTPEILSEAGDFVILVRFAKKSQSSIFEMVHMLSTLYKQYQIKAKHFIHNQMCRLK